VPNYQDYRRSKCSICTHNVDGVCQLILDPEKDRPGIIETGVEMPWVECPIKEWPRVAIRCPKCNRNIHDGENEPRRCRYCKWTAFKPDPGSIGFLGPTYLQAGGTETWHQTLLPNLDGVTGYGVLNPRHAKGDAKKLGVPLGVGLDECRQIAAASTTLVVWGLGDYLSPIIRGMPKKRIISVAHCDAKSDWMINIMNQQAKHTDLAVYIEPSGWDVVPEFLKTKSVMIPNGVCPDRLKTDKDRSSMRRKLGVSRGDHLLLMMSRISEEKQIHKVAEAVQHLPKSYSLAVVGSVQPELRSYLKRFQNLERVHVLPPTDTPGDYYQSADALVSASVYEGCGLSMVEAAIAGLPVIATPVGAVASVPHLICTLPHESDAGQWAKKIKSDFQSIGFQSQRARHAQKYFMQRYSHRLFVQRWAKVLA